MRLVQFKTSEGVRRVGRIADHGTTLDTLRGTESVYQLVLDTIAAQRGLAALVDERAGGGTVDYGAVVAEGRLLVPLDHPDPARCLVSGTGLTHLGSADARDRMHQKAAEEGEESLSDSMKMFKWGLEGGKPPAGAIGAQPEWFYKGDGSILAAPEQPFEMPDFAEDGGEEPELVGLYVIAPDGTPRRVGHALGNEFSDHVMERRNYLFLAHSKLRVCSFGPELLVGDPPSAIRGTSRILRGNEVVWETEFLSGEDNMSHSLANLEHHHFKYVQHRRPGDLHVHYFGAANLSFTDGVKVKPGDVFEISASSFGRPLRNSLARVDVAVPSVQPL